MPQQPVELILTRQWASYLTMPVWLMDAAGSLLYFNEAADALLGRRSDEQGEMHLDAAASLFAITDPDGTPVSPWAFPPAVALRKRRPAHEKGRFRSLDGIQRESEITAFPLEGQSGRHVGAVAIFWEARGPSSRLGTTPSPELSAEPPGETPGLDKEVAVILTKQWASYLAVPVWVMGAAGNLVYYNESAEVLLGRRFDEAGEMPLSELSNIFQIADDDGSPVAAEETPMGIALSERRPAHQPLRWCGLDGAWRRGQVTAFPVEGQGGRNLGVVAIFWETPAK